MAFNSSAAKHSVDGVIYKSQDEAQTALDQLEKVPDKVLTVARDATDEVRWILVPEEHSIIVPGVPTSLEKRGEHWFWK